jgi:starvation-inducible DNA-binding protein
MNTLNYIYLDAVKVGKTVESLQQLLVDFHVFYTNLRDFHWNINGKSFTLHAKFEHMYNVPLKK